MHRNLLLVVVLVMVGCSRAPSGPVPVCFPARPSAAQLDAVQQKALSESERRAAVHCSRKDTQCGYSVVTHAGGEIGVMVSFAMPDPASGKCTQAIGGWHVDVYDEDGNFLRTNPGL